MMLKSIHCSCFDIRQLLLCSGCAQSGVNSYVLNDRCTSTDMQVENRRRVCAFRRSQKVSQGSSPELSCMLRDSCCPCQNVCSKLLRTAPDAEQTLARLGLASFSFSFLCLLRAAAAFLSTSCTCTQHSGTVSTTYTERKLQLGMMKEQHCAPSPKEDVWE